MTQKRFFNSHSDQENYEIFKKIGRGKYSEVFLGFDTVKKEKCVIKALKPVRESKIQREIKILQDLKGGPNIIQLLDLIRDEEAKVPCLVFEWIDNDDPKTLYTRLSDTELRYYMFELLKALDFCHSKGIIHRDVKPQNIVVNHSEKKLKLIDWGLADFYHPHVNLNARVASRYFKGPELLVEYPEYDYALDLWSLGCMLAGIVFKKEPFFHGSDNIDQMVKIVKVLGVEEFSAYLSKYKISLNSKLKSKMKKYPKKPFASFITPENAHLAKDDTIDFIERLLRYDHSERLTAREAMMHPYFNPIRPE